ncbi:MAG: transketolase family protein [Bacteroidetes bacterium]|nr:transketolase family protein [Bacteroidota bacterium]
MSDSFCTRAAYGKALMKFAEKYPEVVVLDADLSAATKTQEFVKTYPERSLNVGISEQDLVCTAAGMSTLGLIPFASTFAVFAAGRATDQIRNCVAYNNMNVKIVGTHGGLNVGEDGGSHQALEDLAIMRAIPNMTVLVPCDADETYQVVEAAIQHKGPVYIRLGRDFFPNVKKNSDLFEIGKAYILREGSAVALFAHGMMVSSCLEAADSLAQIGISAAVINVPTIKPLDTQTILSVVKNVKAVLTVEEHSIIGGLGSAVAETLCESGISGVPFRRMGVNDRFGQTGSTKELLQEYQLTALDIEKAAQQILAD